MPSFGATGRTSSWVFATADALASDKAQANQVLTGTADNVAVTAALTAGYKVITFLGVTSTFAGTVTLLANNTIIHANGVVFSNNATTPLFDDGTKTGCIFENLNTDAGGITYQYWETELQNIRIGTNYIALSSPNALHNTAYGDQCLTNNLTGAAGAFTNTNNGSYNTAFGFASMRLNTSGYLNTAFGVSTLEMNLTGYNNSAFGLDALCWGTGETNCSAFGTSAFAYTTGNFNSGFGAGAGQNTTSGEQNSAFGAGALSNNVSGGDNTAIGFRCLLSNTGGNNSAVGSQCLYNNGAGAGNVAFGYGAMYLNTIGNQNVALGYYAGFYNTTGSTQLFINTLDQGSYANDVSNSLIYGVFNTTPSNQTLSLNAGIINMKYIPTSDPHVIGQIYQVLATHVLMVSNG